MSPTKRKTTAKKTTAKKSAAKKTTAKRSAAKKTAAKGRPAGFADHSVEVARELASIADQHGVSELIYETKDLSLTIRRGSLVAAGADEVVAGRLVASSAMAPTGGAAPIAATTSAPPSPAAEPVDNFHEVTSPFVGTFYRAPNPDSPSYVEPGQRVEKGQVLCIVEAMKLMNEIEADVAGTISAILVKNAESVEYGQSLFKIDPS